MKLLAIDTSTERASVALGIGAEVYSDEQGSLRQHAQLLLPMIDGLLKQASIQLNQLDGIVFGCGPGSFTGLRVACSIAKALAYAHDLPLFPVSSLASIAEEVCFSDPNLAPETRVLAILDARMQQVYWANFSREGILSPEQVSAAEDVCVAPDPLILAGVGLDTYASQFPVSLQTHIIQQRVVYPEARAMIRLVRRGDVQGVSAAQAMPVYVRELEFSKKKS